MALLFQGVSIISIAKRVSTVTQPTIGGLGMCLNPLSMVILASKRLLMVFERFAILRLTLCTVMKGYSPFVRKLLEIHFFFKVSCYAHFSFKKTGTRIPSWSLSLS
jgi:hypothetical protein